MCGICWPASHASRRLAPASSLPALTPCKPATNPRRPTQPDQVRRDLESRPEVVNLQDEQYVRKVADRMQDVVRA